MIVAVGPDVTVAVAKVGTRVLFGKYAGSELKVDGVEHLLLNEDEILEKYLEKYWTPMKAQEQPYEAFQMNSKHIVHTLLKSLKKEKE